MQTYKSLLVGSHFRPPAKTVIEHLPAGALLKLELENDNPYDDQAIKVLVNPSEIPANQHAEMDAKLEGYGSSIAEVLEMASGIFLGYIAASNGKPLREAGGSYSGNLEWRQLLADMTEWEFAETRLEFDPSGKPLVYLVISPIADPAHLDTLAVNQ